MTDFLNTLFEKRLLNASFTVLFVSRLRKNNVDSGDENGLAGTFINYWQNNVRRRHPRILFKFKIFSSDLFHKDVILWKDRLYKTPYTLENFIV